VEASSNSERKAGLRERKKAKTRAEIQRQALRLFRERGYGATTTSQIAEAAEVSESTFFRYFPTKEDVVFWDEFDPLIFEAFRAQPAELGSIRVLRGSIRDAMARASATERADLRERLELLLSVPPLRATLVDRIHGPVRLLAEAMAERTGRHPDDPAVRATAGAVMGVGLSAMFAAADDPDADVLSLLDEGLAQLEAGLPI
jgi:AcrR family transcriptional regulator